MTTRRLALAASLALAAWTVAGCSGDDPTSDPGAGHGSTHASSDAGSLEPPEGADWNEADAEFMTMMPVHHAQALEMADLAAQHAESPQVRALAGSIDLAQGLEIVVYAGWLDDRDLPTPEPEDGMDDMAGMEEMDHGSMPGMLTDAELDELADARGAAFDRLFLRSMIAHHRGAVEMAEDVQQEGIDVRVQELANDVIGSQTGEIGRMRDLLRA